jgi:TolB protein
MRRLLIGMVAAATLLALAAPGTPAGASVFPGPIGKIAFGEPGPDDAGLVVTIDPDGTHRTEITAAGGVAGGAWSPDGGKLLLTQWAGSPLNEARPVTVNPDGSDYTLLDAYPDLPQGLFCQYWSPDGTRLLCNSNDQVGDPPPAGAAGIYTVRSSDAADLSQVIATAGGYFDVGRGYSPDGSRILFLRLDQSNDHSALYTVNPDGSDLVRLTPPGLSVIDLEFFEGAQDWSPDGSRVTFAGFDLSTRGAPHLYVVNADGTALREIAPFGLVPFRPNGPRLVD